MNNKIKYSAVTTFNIQKHGFGVEMINSFFANWPDDINLTAFIENSSGVDDKAVKAKILVKDLIKWSPVTQQKDAFKWLM